MAGNLLKRPRLIMEVVSYGSSCEDQRVGEDFIDELIRKYLLSDTNSLYENESFSAVIHPDTDKWLGEMVLQDFNDNQDYQVPELHLLNDGGSYDCGEPEEELLSILEEIICEDEKKNEGACKSTSKDKTETNPVLEADKTRTLKKRAPISHEAQTNNNKRTISSQGKKDKRPCRSLPIIMKRKAKQRIVEE
ncbi:uncharacterized protein LOC141890658 isoform X2 [Acropora palmata]|uniref:uncharacterized protein LOC141890658 isoform X2 n=1 Tax=Acropora palmata TaxID=6131 RepID=UPI003DA17A86